MRTYAAIYTRTTVGSHIKTICTHKILVKLTDHYTFGILNLYETLLCDASTATQNLCYAQKIDFFMLATMVKNVSQYTFTIFSTCSKLSFFLFISTAITVLVKHHPISHGVHIPLSPY